MMMVAMMILQPTATNMSNCEMQRASVGFPSGVTVSPFVFGGGVSIGGGDAATTKMPIQGLADKCDAQYVAISVTITTAAATTIPDTTAAVMLSY